MLDEDIVVHALLSVGDYGTIELRGSPRTAEAHVEAVARGASGEGHAVVAEAAVRIEFGIER